MNTELTVEELLANVRELRNRFPEPPVREFLMHPRTYAAFVQTIERAETLPSFSVRISVSASAPEGCVIPLDGEGKPIPKPTKSAGEAQRGS